MTKNWKQIMAFWAHGLTNVQPISKSWTTNILFCGEISQPNKKFKLMTNQCFSRFLITKFGFF
jgi:hypothetical protein